MKRLIDADELMRAMKERDEDCGEPKNAVDKGYSLAVEHMNEEIKRISNKKRKTVLGTTIEDLREELSRGCEYSATKDMVHMSFYEAMEEFGGTGDWDEMAAEDLEGQMCVLQPLFEAFYDKTAEKILNHIESYKEDGQ